MTRREEFMVDDSQKHPGRVAADVAAVMITLLTVALGGSALPWQQGIVWSLAGLLMVVSPPQRPLPKWPAVLLALAALCSLAPLLPAQWGAVPAFRGELVETFQIPLGDRIALQPWLTLEGACMLMAGMAWALYLVTRHWEVPRETIFELFAGGVFLLTTVAVFAYLMKFDLALWRVETGAFGFFPHRNQTATLLGIGGIIVLAMGGRRLHEHDARMFVWGAAYLMIAVALVFNYSRAGILIFFFGSLIWLVCSSRISRNYFALGMGLTGLFVLLSLFVLFGGETWQRFKPKNVDAGGSPVLDFRVLVQKDALAMWPEVSWHGLGFGNFEPAFAFHRNLSAIDLRAAHPDSDWLWTFLELGPLGTLALAAALGLLIVRCWPFEAHTQRRLRAAALVAVILFSLHAFIDVSGHVLGTAFAGLLLLGLARHEAADSPVSSLTSWLFRGLGLLVVIFGAVLLVGAFTDLPVRTTGRLLVLKERVQTAAELGDLPAVQVNADEALAIAPLDWEIYFQRGKANVRTAHAESAITDFRRALFLERQTWKLPMAIADLWLPRHPELAVAAWAEAIRRSGADAHNRFQIMLLASEKDPELRARLWPMIEGDPKRLLMFLRQIHGEEFRRYLAAWMLDEGAKVELPVPAIKEVIALWFHRGDRNLLEAQIAASEEWSTLGAPWLAEIAAGKGDFQRAYETAVRASAPPKLPTLRTREGISKLQATFAGANTPDRKITAGISLYQAYADQDRVDEALAVLDELADIKGCPQFVFFLRAQLHARKERWADAWSNWKRYAGEPS